MLRANGYPRIFLHGVCGVFALALHDRLGYPISAFHWRDEDPGDLWAGLEHFFCIAPDRVYVDVRGATGDFQAFCMDFPSPKHFRILEDLDAAQLRTDLAHEMGQDNLDVLYNKAIDEIDAHLESYNV